MPHFDMHAEKTSSQCGRKRQKKRLRFEDECDARKAEPQTPIQDEQRLVSQGFSELSAGAMGGRR